MKTVVESRGLDDRLRGALNHERVDLGLLAPMVRATPPCAIEAIVLRKPTGAFERRLWFLYEWLTGRKLDVPEPAGRLRFVPVLDPARQAALRVGVPSGRHRVIDNLPGTPRFCPAIRWTPALRAASAKQWHGRVRRVAASISPERRSAVASYLQRSEAESSFVLAGGKLSDPRIARWAGAIGQAGARVLTIDELSRLQRVVCGARLTADVEGRGDRAGAPPEDLDSLVGGLIAFAERAVYGGVDPVVAAAALAFGFQRIRPLAMGNGHLHRWLIHHTFEIAGYTSPGFVLPIGAAMIRRLEEYRDVSSVAHGGTADACRFADMTRHAEFLYTCVEDCVERDLREGAHAAID